MYLGKTYRGYPLYYLEGGKVPGDAESPEPVYYLRDSLHQVEVLNQQGLADGLFFGSDHPLRLTIRHKGILSHRPTLYPVRSHKVGDMRSNKEDNVVGYYCLGVRKKDVSAS